MLKLHNPNNYADIIPLVLDDDKWFIVHTYDGLDTVEFEVDTTSDIKKYVQEEVKVETEANRFVIKNIDEHSDFVTVRANLDLDDWKITIIEEFRKTNSQLLEVLSELLPGGWKIVGGGSFTQRTTVEESEGQPFVAVVAADILPTIAETYGCTFQFKVLEKTIEVIDPKSYAVSGEYFTDEINLKSLGYVGNTDGFATRLYAYGKKDEETGERMTFASINGGKPYVEDKTYSDKVISVGWSDERYTVKENLLADAKKRLAELASPARSYSCDVENLAADMWIYKVVTLIDRVRGIRIDHQVVEYKEYQNHNLDVVVLSSVAPDLRSTVRRVQDSLNGQIAKEKSVMQQVMREAIDYATERITGNKGGHFLWIFDSDGLPTELVNLADSMDVNTAKKVWRWNASGLGHSNNGYGGPYDLALLDDGSINATMITTGTLTANLIRAGKLADTQGYNFWDLGTGEFSLSATQTKVGGNTLSGYVDNKVSNGISDYDDELDQQTVFDKLTNGGSTQGIYLNNGRVYINASYINTGTLTANLIKGGTLKDNSGNLEFDLGTGVLKANKLSIESTYFSLSTSGILKATSAELINATIKSSSGSYGINIQNARMRMTYNDTLVGYIGCNNWSSDVSKIGLVFDVENAGQYWALSAREPGSSVYYTKWWWDRDDDMVKFGGNVDARWFRLTNVALYDSSINQLRSVDGYSVADGTFNFICKIEATSDGGFQWWNGSLIVRHGILTYVSSV